MSNSELKVMQSGAGYYIGREWNDPAGFTEPASRESDYYQTRDEAQKELDAMSFKVRDCLENNAAYDSGALPDIR